MENPLENGRILIRRLWAKYVDPELISTLRIGMALFRGLRTLFGKTLRYSYLACQLVVYLSPFNKNYKYLWTFIIYNSMLKTTSGLALKEFLSHVFQNLHKSFFNIQEPLIWHISIYTNCLNIRRFPNTFNFKRFKVLHVLYHFQKVIKSVFLFSLLFQYRSTTTYLKINP